MGGRYDCASLDTDAKSVSKSHSVWNDTLSSAKVSELTSDGFLSPRKWAARPGFESFLQDWGGASSDGFGGFKDGKVTGIGRAGGALSFSLSCWPARRPPRRGKHGQRCYCTCHDASPKAKRVLPNPWHETRGSSKTEGWPGSQMAMTAGKRRLGEMKRRGWRLPNRARSWLPQVGTGMSRRMAGGAST